MSAISMIGAGAFGTAVAATLAICGNEVLLYCRTAEQAERIRATGENAAYLPGHQIPVGIEPTNDLARALQADFVFLAVPARAINSLADDIRAGLRDGAIVVNLMKGLNDEFFTFAALFESRVPQARYVALKGATFAKPLFLGEWSGFTCGSPSEDDRAAVAGVFCGEPVHLDFASSAHAVDAVSAIKNAYAIVFGMTASLGLAENTVYMLVTRVLNEIRGVVRSLGFNEDILFRYCGIGDILLTSFCDASRNRTLGVMIGKGIPVDPMRPDFLAEGVRTVLILLAHLPPGTAPILARVGEILNRRAAPISILDALG